MPSARFDLDQQPAKPLFQLVICGKSMFHFGRCNIHVDENSLQIFPAELPGLFQAEIQHAECGGRFAPNAERSGMEATPVRSLPSVQCRRTERPSGSSAQAAPAKVKLWGAAPAMGGKKEPRGGRTLPRFFVCSGSDFASRARLRLTPRPGACGRTARL